jgi:FkbM family methyltransferase
MKTESQFRHEGEIVVFHHPTYDHISKSWNRGEFYEQELLNLVQSLNLNGCYVDIGAHHGNHTVFFSLFCKADKVVAIEGNPVNFEYLEMNITENLCENVQAVGVLVGAEDMDKVNLYWNDGNTGVATTIKREQYENTAFNQQKTLDDILNNEKDISLMKFDIQGAEWSAIQGSKKVIEKHQPIIIIELMAWNKDDTKIKQYFEDIGYEITRTIKQGNTPMFLFESRRGCE